ncbi:hypothetical protein THAOC_22847, partial [Thalassiosira oceanica]
GWTFPAAELRGRGYAGRPPPRGGSSMQMRRRQPGLPPVEVEVAQEDSGRRPHPQRLPVLPVNLQGGAKAWAVAAPNVGTQRCRQRKVQWSYVDGSTYVGEALDEKRDGQGTLTRHGGVRDGVFKNGKFDEGTATNVKCGSDGGKLNGTGKITLADGGEFEGTFVNNRFDKGMAKNMKLKFLNDGFTYTGQMAGGGLNGTGTVTSS